MANAIDIMEYLPNSYKTRDEQDYINFIWESLIRYDDIGEYDKIFFLTKDGDYKENCYEEFNSMWPEQEILIRKDPAQIIIDIERIYQEYLAEKELYDFTESDVFTQTLTNDLAAKQSIQIGENSFQITGYTVDNFASKIEKLLPDEDEVENIAITSEITISYLSHEETLTQDVIATTLLFDEETKEIISTEYDTELK